MTTIRQLIKIPVAGLIAILVLLHGEQLAQAQVAPSPAAETYALHEDLLKCYQALGKSEETEGEYKWLLAARPSNALLHFNYAVLLKNSGKKAAALVEYEKAAAYDGSNVDYIGQAGQMFMFMGNRQKALQYLNKAMSMPGGDKYRVPREYLDTPLLYDALPPRNSRTDPRRPNDDNDD